MGFFKSAHNFIIDGSEDDETSVLDDPRDIADQAIAKAYATVDMLRDQACRLRSFFFRRSDRRNST